MSLIQNMVARLTMDSTAFDRNAKGASQSMRGMMSASLALQQQVVGLAGAYLSARGLVAGIKSVARAGMEAESADRSMIAALRIKGQYSEASVDLLRRQAEGMQDLTVYSRNTIKEQQSLALTMGASVSEIDSMTEAAVGLAAAYKKDLSQAMRVIALARQGETGQLKEMGIVVDRTRSKHKQYLQVLDLGTKNFQKAREDTETLQGSISQLANEWEKTKAALAAPFTPALGKALRAIRLELEGKTPTGIPVWDQIKQLPKEQQGSLWKAYRQRLAETPVGMRGDGTPILGASDDPAYLQRLANAYSRSPDVQARIKEGIGTDGASAASGMAATQKEQIIRLNEQIKEQIAIQREAATGNLHAAETVRYLAAAEEDYGKGTKEAEAAMVKFNSAMATLDELRSRAAATELIESMEQENEVLSLIRAGREEEAQTLQIINDLKRQGIDLTDEERDRVEALVAETEKLQKGYGNDVMGGMRGGIKSMQEDLGGLGDLSFDVVTKGIDGIAESLSAAALRGEDFGESMRQVGLNIADMILQWGIKSALTGIMGGVMGVGMHAGGIVGRDRTFSRMVSPLVFAGAPRLHGGLAQDEFPTILQRGEEVRSRADVAAGASSGARVESALARIAALLERRQSVNLSASIVDSREVVTRRQMESREGERMVMYHVGRNQ